MPVPHHRDAVKLEKGTVKQASFLLQHIMIVLLLPTKLKLSVHVLHVLNKIQSKQIICFART